MILFRIAKRKYVEDLSGEGARLFGGRWNPKGTNVIYTAESRSLATVEYLVHLPMSLIPVDIYLAEIHVPDHVNCAQIDPETLPEDWTTSPPPFSLSRKGEEWIRSHESLLLRVPSAVVRMEWNVLINPNHESASEITIASIAPFSFDDRLLKKSFNPMRQPDR